MDCAERFKRCMHYEAVDHVPDIEFGYWRETFLEWFEQGLEPMPIDIITLELYFGLDQLRRIPMNVSLHPDPEPVLIETRDGFNYIRDHDLVLVREPANQQTTMPEHLEYTLRDEASWEQHFRPLLDPATPGRIPEALERWVETTLENNEIVQILVGSMLGWPRNWMGFEHYAVSTKRQPALMERIADEMCEVTCALLDEVLPRVGHLITTGHFWEDICFNSGPIVSPKYFKETAAPRYKEITKRLNAYGIDIISVDSDGDVSALVEGWLEAGVNAMFPMERQAGCDPVEFRRRYGKAVRLMGGFPKMLIAEGAEAVRRELERLAPVVEEGGFIPFCDHGIPPNVTLAQYRDYLRLKREIFGIPQKEETRRESAKDLP